MMCMWAMTTCEEVDTEIIYVVLCGLMSTVYTLNDVIQHNCRVQLHNQSQLIILDNYLSGIKHSCDNLCHNIY
jgi:hypothetical protein